MKRKQLKWAGVIMWLLWAGSVFAQNEETFTGTIAVFYRVTGVLAFGILAICIVMWAFQGKADRYEMRNKPKNTRRIQ